MHRYRVANRLPARLADPTVTFDGLHSLYEPAAPPVCRGATNIPRVVSPAHKLSTASVRTEPVPARAFVLRENPWLPRERSATFCTGEFNWSNPGWAIRPSHLVRSEGVSGSPPFSKLVPDETWANHFSHRKMPLPAARFTAKTRRLRTVRPYIKWTEAYLTDFRNHQQSITYCMGSGSAGIAALKHGRRFIGIENDPAMAATAAHRILTHNEQN